MNLIVNGSALIKLDNTPELKNKIFNKIIQSTSKQIDVTCVQMRDKILIINRKVGTSIFTIAN